MRAPWLVVELVGGSWPWWLALGRVPPGGGVVVGVGCCLRTAQWTRVCVFASGVVELCSFERVLLISSGVGSCSIVWPSW